MSSPRERQLAEGIKNKLIAVQKSEQIYKNLSKWERRALTLDEKKIEKIANAIAKKVDNYAKRIEGRTGNSPTSRQIMAKIKSELNKI